MLLRSKILIIASLGLYLGLAEAVDINRIGIILSPSVVKLLNELGREMDKKPGDNEESLPPNLLSEASKAIAIRTAVRKASSALTDGGSEVIPDFRVVGAGLLITSEIRSAGPSSRNVMALMTESEFSAVKSRIGEDSVGYRKIANGIYIIWNRERIRERLKTGLGQLEKIVEEKLTKRIKEKMKPGIARDAVLRVMKVVARNVISLEMIDEVERRVSQYKVKHPEAEAKWNEIAHQASLLGKQLVDFTKANPWLLREAKELLEEVDEASPKAEKAPSIAFRPWLRRKTANEAPSAPLEKTH